MIILRCLIFILRKEHLLMKTKIMQTLINHKGKEHAISSSQIAKELNIPDDATYFTTRRLVKETINEFGLPIASCANGYYFIVEEDEYNEYMNSLMARIAGIEKRMSMVRKNYLLSRA